MVLIKVGGYFISVTDEICCLISTKLKSVQCSGNSAAQACVKYWSLIYLKLIMCFDALMIISDNGKSIIMLVELLFN